MLCTFATTDGTLIVRAEDIRWIEDEPPREGRAIGCRVAWLAGDSLTNRFVLGTAIDNLNRITAEEKTRIEEATRMQERLQRGLPGTPVARGRA